MAQIDADDYVRLTAVDPVYGRSDGVFYSAANQVIAFVINGNVVGTIDTDGTILAGALEATDLEVSGETRGDLLYRAASEWARLSVGSDAAMLISDGTDPGWVALSGDATIDNAGVVSLDPTLIQYATASISSANITGTGAGQLGHAAGVEIVAAPAAGYALEFLSGVVILDYDTAAYTDGGDIAFAYGGGGATVSGAVTYANSVGGSADKVALALATAPTNNQLTAAAGLNLVAASAPTQPGTAAGVLRVKVAYRVHATGL